MIWKRHDGLKNTGNGGVGVRGVYVTHTYTPEGKLYPRLTLSIRKLSEGGYALTCSEKHNAKARWEDCGIPRPLLRLASVMISEVMCALHQEDKLATLKAEGMDSASMVPRRMYRLKSRNLSQGVWCPKVKAFYGIRTKWGDRYVDREYHWDTGSPHGTATPLEDLGIDLPPELELNRDYNEPLDTWLKAQEPETPTERSER